MENKIKIITLYSSLNFGAFLQAFALQKFLKDINYLPSFYDVNNNINSEIRKHILRKDIRKIPINYIQYKKYRKCWKFLNVDNSDFQYAKACIIGSDEIWNVKNSSFYHAPEYFGFNINNKNIISYAPSANVTTADDLRKFDNNLNFEKFSSISVRDKNSFNLVRSMSNKKVTLVVDPTMLIEDYSEFEDDIKTNDRYILIYGYKFSKFEIESIKQLSKKTGYKLYSIGMPQMWCDKQITATPFEFLSYIKNAEMIVTETFHGTIFSILYNKNFVAFVNHKSKLEDLLDRFNLNSRDVSGREDLISVLEEKIDYEKVNKILEKERKKSAKWLIDAIEK